MAKRPHKWAFFIDVVGGCNLRCPSCPVGNSSDKTTPHGLMAPELLDRICAKAVREFGDPSVYLFKWAEPFLHPRLDEMIGTVKRHGLAVEVSSNGNISRNVEAVVAAEPRAIIITVSGFQQENYGKTHKRGDIERVKATMTSLGESKRRLRVRTKLIVRFLRYLGNHEDEARMKTFAEGLGFEFSAVWAYLMPAEKAVALGQGGLGDDHLSDEDRNVIGQFALNSVEAIEIAKKHRDRPCRLLERSIALTHTGDVVLCCETYNVNRFSIGSFLDLSGEAIQKRREQHDFCGACTTQGVHVLAGLDSPEFDAAAIARISKHYPEIDVKRFDAPKQTAFQRALRHASRLIRIAN